VGHTHSALLSKKDATLLDLGELLMQEMIFVSVAQGRCVYFQGVSRKNKPLRGLLNRTYRDMHYHIDNLHLFQKI
jgi:hypothetical protein